MSSILLPFLALTSTSILTLRGGAVDSKFQLSLPPTSAITNTAVAAKMASGLVSYVWPSETLECYNVTAATEEQEVFFRLAASTYILQAAILVTGQSRGLLEATTSGLAGTALMLLANVDGCEKLDSPKEIVFALSSILLLLARASFDSCGDECEVDGAWPLVGYLTLSGAAGAVAPKWLLSNIFNVDADKRVSDLGLSLFSTHSIAKLATAAYFVVSKVVKEKRAHPLGMAALLGAEALGCAKWLIFDAKKDGVSKVAVGAWGIFQTIVSALALCKGCSGDNSDESFGDSTKTK